MHAQQKMMLMRSNPNVARDLDLTPEQVDRLFGTLAEQSLRWHGKHGRGAVGASIGRPAKDAGDAPQGARSSRTRTKRSSRPRSAKRSTANGRNTRATAPARWEATRCAPRSRMPACRWTRVSRSRLHENPAGAAESWSSNGWRSTLRAVQAPRARRVHLQRELRSERRVADARIRSSHMAQTQRRQRDSAGARTDARSSSRSSRTSRTRSCRCSACRLRMMRAQAGGGPAPIRRRE